MQIVRLLKHFKILEIQQQAFINMFNEDGEDAKGNEDAEMFSLLLMKHSTQPSIALGI